MVRLHPFSPLVRFWGWFVVGALYLWQQGGADQARRQPLLVLGVVVVLAGISFVTWRFTGYELTSEHLRVRTGVLVRQVRTLPLARLQAVETRRTLVSRIFGLTELRLEVAGGEAEASLAYLTDSQAQALRARLLALAAGLSGVTPDTAAPVAPERTLVDVPVRRFIAALVLRSEFVVPMLIAVGALTAAAGTLSAAPILVLVPALLAAGTNLVREADRDWAFRTAMSPDGLRLRHGLMDTRAQTVAPGRVQAVLLERPLLWRLLGTGWSRVSATIAGYGADPTSTVLLPTATDEEVRTILAAVLPADPFAVGLAPSPGRARWRAPVSAGSLWWGADEQLFVGRRGVLTQRTEIVPHAKIQSLRVVAGPWSRALRLASVRLDCPPGPVRAAAHLVDPGTAARLLADVSSRARAGRAAAAPERWMQLPQPAEPQEERET